MKRRKGLFKLLHDCGHNYKLFENEKILDGKDKESLFEDAHVIEAQSTQEEYYDFGEPLSMSYSEDYLYEQSVEEDYTFEQGYGEDEYGYEHSYGADTYRYEQTGEDSEAFYVEPFESKHDEDGPVKKPMPEFYPPPEKGKPARVDEPRRSAGKMPKPDSDFNKPTIEIDKRDLEEDIKAIMRQQKEYDSFQKKMAPQEAPKPKEIQTPKQKAEEPSIDEVLKNEHQIFDKIAQSMKMANAYDLGSIALEQRFDSFDQEMKAEEKKRDGLVDTSNQAAHIQQSMELGTDEFLTDLDEMARQRSSEDFPSAEWENGPASFESQTGGSTLAFTAGDNKVNVYKDTNNNRAVLHFKSEMAVEGDGAPTAYHPEKSRNGGGLEGWGNGGIKEVITHNGKYYVHGKQSNGKPYAIVIDDDDQITRDNKKYYRAYTQGPNDPAPGYFFSTTALVQAGKKATQFGRYADASATPFISFTDWRKFKRQDAEKGDFVSVYCCETKNLVHAVVGDVGGGSLGEGSMFLAKALLGRADAPTYKDRAGNTRLATVHKDIIYIVYPNSGSTSKIPSNTEIKSTGQRLFDEWGGMGRLKTLYPDCG